MAIAAAATSDTIAKVMSHLNVGIFLLLLFVQVSFILYVGSSMSRFFSFCLHDNKLSLSLFDLWSMMQRAVQEERYGDAALLRDYAGAGLVS